MNEPTGHSRVRCTAATLVWVGGVAFSFVLAMSLGTKDGRALGTWLAHLGLLPIELGLGLGSVVGMAAAAGVAQLVAALVAAAIRGGERRRSAGDVRRDVAVATWWGLHTFPVSSLYLVALPLGRDARTRLAARRPWLARVLAAAYLAAFAAFFLGLVRWAPFFDDAEIGFFVAFAVVVGTALAALPERRRNVLMVAAGVLALYFTVDPPQQVGFEPRLWVALGVLALGVGPALLAGREGCRSMGVVGPTLGLLLLGMWAWWGEFLLFPSVRDAARIDAQPGVTILYENASGGAWSDNRFLMEACDPQRILYGSREVTHGIVRLEGGRPMETLHVHTGYNLVTDCTKGIGYVGDYTGGEIDRIDLATFTLLPPVPKVQIGGPTLLQLSPDGRRLYAIDDTNGQFRRIDVATGHEDLELRECLPNGLFVDETHGRVYLPSCGWLDVYATATGRQLGHVDLRRGFDPPFPFGPHFHRVTGDPTTGKVFVSYLETGRVYRIDGVSGALEAEKRVGRGVRDITWDAHNHVVWVGNYVTGDLLMLDPDSLDVVGRIPVGRRIRSIEPSLDGRRVYVTSAVGGIRVDVAAVRTHGR